MIEFEDDEFSVVKLFDHIQHYFLPSSDSGIDVSRVFRRHASNKEMKARVKERHSFTIGMHLNDVWGSDYFTKQMKALEIRCRFDNPTRCTGQGKRTEGISRMVNSSDNIPLCESMAVARHGSVDAHLGYAKPDELAHGKRYRAMAPKVESINPKAMEEALVEWKATLEKKVIEAKAKAEPEPEKKLTVREWDEHESKKRKVVGEHMSAVGGMGSNAAMGFNNDMMGFGNNDGYGNASCRNGYGYGDESHGYGYGDESHGYGNGDDWWWSKQYANSFARDDGESEWVGETVGGYKECGIIKFVYFV